MPPFFMVRIIAVTILESLGGIDSSCVGMTKKKRTTTRYCHPEARRVYACLEFVSSLCSSFRYEQVNACD